MIPQSIRYLMEGGHQAPSADNSQPWSFTWDGESLSLHYEDEGIAANVFGKGGHCEKLTMGAVIENIIQLADAIGMRGAWDLVPKGLRYLRFTPTEWPDNTTLTHRHPIFSRHTNRFTFLSQRIPQRLVTNLASMQERGCHIELYSSANQIARVAGLIREASSMRFRNRLLHEWFAKTLRFTQEQVEQGTGLDVRTIDLPPGGTALLKVIMDWRRMAALNALGMYRLLATIESKAVKTAPALLAILGPPKQETLAAGRLLERAWLACEQERLAAQPYYVLSDQLVRLDLGQLPNALREDSQRLKDAAMNVFGEKKFPHMLLRIGYSNTSVQKSRRRPLELVASAKS